MVEQTLAVIRPHGVIEEVAEQIKQRYRDGGLRIVKEREHRMREEDVRELYKEHVNRPFFECLVCSMIAGPSIALLLEGESAIRTVRELNGATDPTRARPGTIRYDFRHVGPLNTVHGSDSPEAAAREIELVFSRAS
jgi:nucleoside-diphosphate kinase